MSKTPPTRITSIKEIAKIADCSIATVSNALNGKGRISESVREEIFEICRKHGYRPNSAGRNLRRQRTETIGLIFYPSCAAIFQNIYYAEILESINLILEQRNHDLLLSGFNSSRNKDEKDPPRFVAQGKVDGLVLLGGFPRETVKRFKDYGLPLILLDDQRPRMKVNSITTDGLSATTQIVDHLASVGHRRMVFMAYRDDGYNADQRMKGFQIGIEKHKLPKTLNHCLRDFTDSDQGYDRLKNLLGRKRPPTAVVAVNDTLASDLQEELKKDGLSVPGDLSLFGYDDDAFSQNAEPPISTVRVDKHCLAEKGLEILFNQIENPSIPLVKKQIPASLIHRDSVAAPKR